MKTSALGFSRALAAKPGLSENEKRVPVWMAQAFEKPIFDFRDPSMINEVSDGNGVPEPSSTDQWLLKLVGGKKG